MANNITGKTDTTGALSTVAKSPKCILLVGKTAVTGDPAPVLEKIQVITGTGDAAAMFGANHPFVEITKILIKNGADYIKGIAVGDYGASKPYTDAATAYEAAFTKSLVVDDIKIVLIDKTSEDAASINAKLKEHMTEAENNDMFRYGVIGGPIGATDEALQTLATATASKRIFCAGPNVVDGSNAEKDGVFTAAGLAAKIMTETNDPALPMNGVTILGYDGVSRKLLKSSLDSLVAKGVTPLYPEGGSPNVYRLVTTLATDKIWQEGTTVFIADDVLSSVEALLRANYKRTKNVARVLDSIRGDVISVLGEKNALEIIQNFDPTTVSVVRDPEDLYGALVDYEFQVVTPLYNISITQHMKL